MGTGYKAHHCVECGSSYYGGMTGQPIACPYCVIIELEEEVETWKLRADKRWSQLDIDTASELGLLKLQNMKLSSELHEMREAIKLND